MNQQTNPTTAAEVVNAILGPRTRDVDAGYDEYVALVDTYARQQVEAALERAAQVVDRWACSTTCDSTGAPCEHIRVAVTIAAAIRALTGEGGDEG